MTNERVPHPSVGGAASRLFAGFGLVYRLIGIRPMPTRWRMLVRLHARSAGFAGVRADVATLVLLFLQNAFVMCNISGVRHAVPPYSVEEAAIWPPIADQCCALSHTSRTERRTEMLADHGRHLG